MQTSFLAAWLGATHASSSCVQAVLGIRDRRVLLPMNILFLLSVQQELMFLTIYFFYVG